MKKAILIFLTVLAVVFPSSVYAASPWTTQPTYVGKICHKLEFGLANLMGGWTELVNQPMAYQAAGRNPVMGLGQGLINTLIYTVGGVLNTATFPILVDIPLPNNGVDMD